jgi:hypothetical protein
VICIVFDPQSMRIGPFLWLGTPPNQPTPRFGDRIGRHSKGDQQGRKAPRLNIRVVKKSVFIELNSMEGLANACSGCRNQR